MKSIPDETRFFQASNSQIPPFSAKFHPSVQIWSVLRLIYQQRQADEEMLRERRRLQEGRHILAHMDNVLAQRIDLFGTPMKWQQRGKESYTLTVNDDTLYLDHMGNNLYQVYIDYADRPMPLPILKNFITFEHAQSLCTLYAQKMLDGKGHLLNPQARWKREPATEKNLEALRRCKIAIPEHCTKGEASILLDLYWSHPSKFRQQSRQAAS